MADERSSKPQAGEKTSPYPAPGSGETTKPQTPEPGHLPDTTAPTRAPGVPAPQVGGPEKPAGSPPSTGVGGK